MRSRTNSDVIDQQSTKTIELEITETTSYVVHVAVPGNTTEEQFGQLAVVIDESRQFAHDAESEDWGYRISDASPDEATMRAVPAGDGWDFWQYRHESPELDARGRVHDWVLRRYDGDFKEVEYNLVTCESSEGELAHGIAYYRPAYTIVVAFWKNEWDVAVLPGFDRCLPVKRQSGTLPWQAARIIEPEETETDDGPNEFAVMEAMSKAGMPLQGCEATDVAFIACRPGNLPSAWMIRTDVPVRAEAIGELREKDDSETWHTHLADSDSIGGNSNG